MRPQALSLAAAAFDASADGFDTRFGAWQSVAAQRDAVRRALLSAFPPRSRLLEIGGGTGEDAAWLSARGRHVLLTDASPRMVAVAATKLRTSEMRPRVLSAETLGTLADERAATAAPPFDGVFSNFAALNCVDDLRSLREPLARLVRPGGRAMLVLFGTSAPGEVVTQLARGDAAAAFRRRHRGAVSARLGGRAFTIRYHRCRDIVAALAPEFRLERRHGIGVFVPPSAAEPWISRHPALLGALRAADRVVARPLAALGDHVLYELVRT